MGSKLLDRNFGSFDPQLLKPVLRAYALGYATTTGPRVVSFLRILRRQDLSNQEKANHLVHVLCSALRWNRFPTFCALLAGGTSLLPALIEVILRLVSKGLRSRESLKLSPQFRRLLRFGATLLSAWFCFPILNSRKRPESKPNEMRKDKNSNIHKDAQDRINVANNEYQTTETSEFAGRTLDLTLFASIRALDVVTNIIWDRWKKYRGSQHRNSRFASHLPRLADTGVFAASSAIVMWAWFYMPERLPFSYGRWIGDAAQVDSRLIEALRTARRGDWLYGHEKDTPMVLEPMCEDYGWPIIWGDTSKTIPIPCEMVHMGCGPSCEKHAAWRFAKSFIFAFTMYLPLQLAVRWRSCSIRSLLGAIKSSTRSSAFLGLFISLFYYSVCLARTRIGPKLFSAKRVTPMMWDSGLCVAAGCIMCGWSIFVENAKKRQEVALFVAPRAAATLLPRRYERKHQWRESIAFTVSTAIVLTSIQENPKMVRGMLGKVLTGVFKK